MRLPASKRQFNSDHFAHDMKKAKPISSNTVEILKSYIPVERIVDMFTENNYLVAVLNTGLHIKIKQ